VLYLRLETRECVQTNVAKSERRRARNPRTRKMQRRRKINGSTPPTWRRTKKMRKRRRTRKRMRHLPGVYCQATGTLSES